MKDEAMILTLKVISALIVVAGVLMLGASPALPGIVKGILIILGIILIAFGALFFKKVNDLANKYGYKTKHSRERKIMSLVFLVLTTASIVFWIVSPLIMQSGTEYCDTESCPMWRHYIVMLEGYVVFIMALMMLIGIIAFTTGRTLLGGLLGELQQFVLGGIFGLLILTGFLVPLHVAFVPCTTGETGGGTGGGGGGGGGWAPAPVVPHYENPTVQLQTTGEQGCYVSLEPLLENGPILLRWILNAVLLPTGG